VSSSNFLSESEKKGPVSDYFLAPFKELALANPYFTEQMLYDAIGIENKSGLISVNEARRIFEKLSLRAAEGSWKTMIIYLPEKMNLDAANKLLKIVEEPYEKTFFLMVSNNPEQIIGTIQSRVQRLQLAPIDFQGNFVQPGIQQPDEEERLFFLRNSAP
jgi:DNA polymerase-3 subunit delta'